MRHGIEQFLEVKLLWALVEDVHKLPLGPEICKILVGIVHQAARLDHIQRMRL